MTFTCVASLGVLTRAMCPTQAVFSFITLVYVCKTEQPCSLLSFDIYTNVDTD